MIINFEYKSILFCFLICLYSSGIFSQNTAITDDDSYNAHSSAMLDVYSQTKGMLVPRLSTSQMNGISSAAPGLLIFNTDSTRFYFYTGAEWMAVQGGQFLQTSADSVVYFSTDKYVGVGTSQPMSKLSVQASSTNSNVPLFDVKNQAGDVIFAVYESGVEINFNEDAMAKGAKGGFAVGGLSTGKAGTKEYLRITPDSVRIYFDDASGKGAKGGFAVGGLSTGKAMGNKYFTLSDTNARIDLRPAAKGAKGGFAVGGLSTGKSTASDLFTISPDSARIYIDSDAKGAKGGFAVGGLSTGKAGSQDYLRITRDSARMYLADPAKGAKGGFAVGGLSTGKASSNFLDLTPENYFIGHGAGANTTPGSGNKGLYNSFFGYEAGMNNDTGYQNIFIGYNAGKGNVFGFWNTFLGVEAGLVNTGSDNTFIGYRAGSAHQNQGGNVYLGSKAGELATNGQQNVYIGESAGTNTTFGKSNVFIGFRSGYNNTGDEFDPTRGSFNVYLGYEAGLNGNTVAKNVFLGYHAGMNTIGGTDLRDGCFNVFLGSEAGLSNTIGKSNTAIGDQALLSNTEGNWNVAIGRAPLYANTTGDYNVAFGNGALYFNTSGSANIAIGNAALGANTAGDKNVAIGQMALMALGYENAPNDLDTANVAIGSFALENLKGGTKNTAIGNMADVQFSGINYNNSTAIGYGATITLSNQVVIGNDDVTRFVAKGVYDATTTEKANVYVTTTGRLMRSTNETVSIGEFMVLEKNARFISNLATLTPATSFERLVGGSFMVQTHVTLNGTTAIADGTYDGQVLIVQGNNNSATVTINDGANTSMNGNVTLGKGDTIMFIWDSNNTWVEISRSNN